MGEGGAVYTDDRQLKLIIDSFRDWGRDCFCNSGKDDSCGMRFDRQFGELPLGYDHKYVYSHFGYNLKATDMQAAIGCAQLKKLSFIVNRRKVNWEYIKAGLKVVSDVLILPEPTKNSDPSWFGFIISVKDDAPFGRNELVEYLEKSNIQTRMLFAGNLIKHPCFDEMRSSGEGYRVIGSLTNTDNVMNNGFWIGVYPGMSLPMLDYMIQKIVEFCQK